MVAAPSSRRGTGTCADRLVEFGGTVDGTGAPTCSCGRTFSSVKGLRIHATRMQHALPGTGNDSASDASRVETVKVSGKTSDGEGREVGSALRRGRKMMVKSLLQ